MASRRLAAKLGSVFGILLLASIVAGAVGNLGNVGTLGSTGTPSGASFFGVNVDWAELSSPTYPVANDWTYLANKQIKYARFPFAWENVQRTLLGTLDATTMTNIQTVLSSASAKGIGVILDVHNFGGYANSSVWGSTVTGAGNSGNPATGVNFLGDGTLTTATFTDLWTKLATAVVGKPGLAGYCIMNEPSVNVVGTNLIDGPNYFDPNTIANYTLSTGTAPLTQLAAGTNPLGASYSPAWQIANIAAGYAGFRGGWTFTAVPYTLSIYARTVSGTAAFQLQIAGTSSSVLTATTSWQRFSFTSTPAAGFNSFNFFYNAGNASTPAIQLANFQLELGSSATAYVPNKWLPFAQAAINAIRAVDSTTPIYINGITNTQPAVFAARNYELGTLLTGSNLIFETHAYFDGPQGRGNGGNYGGTFSSYSINVDSGWQSMQPFVAWLQATGVQGFVGEFGVPNDTIDNDQQWITLQQGFLSYLRQNNIKGTAWFFGSNTSVKNDALNVAPAGGPDDPRITQIISFN